MKIIKKTKKVSLSFLFALITFTLGSSYPAYSYQYDTWDGTKVNWCGGEKPVLNISTKSFSDGSAMQDALLESIDLWNNDISKFFFQVSLSYNALYQEGDGAIDIGLVNPDQDPNLKKDDDSEKGPAIALIWQAGDCLYDADILFSSQENWITSKKKADHMEYGSGGGRSFHTAVLHELGHALGLNHEDKYYNIMGMDWKNSSVNGDNFSPFIGSDAQDGATFLYGLTDDSDAQVSDWIISHYKYWQPDSEQPEYANAQRTEIYNSLTGKPLPSLGFDEITEKFASPATSRAYEVYPGQTIDAEFNIQASLKTPGESVLLQGLYSEDSFIDSQDQILMQESIFCKSHNCQNDWLLNMTIPVDSNTGIYYIGAQVNSTQTSEEKDDNNNASYIPVFVNKPPVQANFTVQEPLESMTQATKIHLDEVKIVSQQFNTVQVKFAMTNFDFPKFWNIDVIYYDAKKQDTVVISDNKYVGYNPVFTLYNVSDVQDGKNPQAIYVRFSREDMSFGATFYVTGQIVPFQKSGDIIPGKPTLLSQDPLNGKLFTSAKKNYHTNFTLKAHIGDVPEQKFGYFILKETCHVKFTVSKNNNPDQAVLTLYSTQASPNTAVEKKFSGKLEQGTYTWKAQTICGEKNHPYHPYRESQTITYAGEPLHVQYLATDTTSSGRFMKDSDKKLTPSKMEKCRTSACQQNQLKDFEKKDPKSWWAPKNYRYKIPGNDSRMQNWGKSR